MMSIIDLIHKYSLKNKAVSITKIQQIPSSSFKVVKIFLGNGPFTTNVGIVKLNPTKRHHWVAIINQNYFDSYGAPPPEEPSKFLKNEMDLVHILNKKSNVSNIEKTLFE